MTVRRVPLSSLRHELGSNTITAALHISDGLDDYQPNVIIDLHVRKIGRVHEVKQKCLYVSASVFITYVFVISYVCKVVKGELSTSNLINEAN